MNLAALSLWLCEALARRTGLPLNEFDVNRPIADYGVDSAVAMDVAGELSNTLGSDIDASLFFEEQTISKVAERFFLKRSMPAVGSLSDNPAGCLSVVGMACRFPGAADLGAFWANLVGSVDAVAAPSSARLIRMDEPSGEAGYLQEVDRFDAVFFGIRADEARVMDPQQRWLLETVWDALQDAGLDPAELRGSATGVFVGISRNEYAKYCAPQSESAPVLAPMGNSLALAANRVSYTFDFSGPSLSIDTACSSSLVALHLAKESIRRGECEIAVVAGVNALLDPGLTTLLERAGMVSKTRRCRTFDESADGYTRGEGCGVVVICSEERAARGGLDIYAHLAGSAVNQDGATNGLTAPNPLAQTAVITKALADANIGPLQVAYLEAHGTGTPLGDPIEVRAAARAYRPEAEGTDPLLIGALKSSIGHLEAAAGIAGVIKVCLCLKHQLVPPNLHFNRPNPRINFRELSVKPVVELTDLSSRPQFAGVSGFGFGGTNGHAIFRRSLRKPDVDPAASARPQLLLLSSKTHEGLVRTASAWGERLSLHPTADLAQVASEVNRRTKLPFRTTVIATSTVEMSERLQKQARTLAAAAPDHKVDGKTTFVFSGVGGEWPGMGVAIAARSNHAADMIENCLGLLDPGLRGSVSEYLLGHHKSAKPSTAVIQPAIFISQAALIAELASHQVWPGIAMGHSVGEIAACYSAGALTLEDGLRLAVKRGAAMKSLNGKGAMLYVEADNISVLKAKINARVEIAAINSSTTFVLSGDRDAIDLIASEWVDSGYFSQRVSANYAFHSSMCVNAAATFARSVENVHFKTSNCEWIPTALLPIWQKESPSVRYFEQAIPATVNFAESIEKAIKLGSSRFVEIGGQPVLRGELRRIVGKENSGVLIVAPNVPKDDGRRYLDAVGKLFVDGVPVHVAGVLNSTTLMPGYQWSEDRHWLAAEAATPAPSGEPHLVKVPVSGSPNISLYVVQINTKDHWLADHVIGDRPILPAAAFLALIAKAADLMGIHSPWLCENINYVRQLPLDRDELVLSISLTKGNGCAESIEVSSTKGVDGSQIYCRAERISSASKDDSGPVASVNWNKPSELGTVEHLYAELNRAGYQYGPEFRNLTEVREDDGRLQGKIRSLTSRWSVDPRIIDSTFHLLAAGTIAEPTSQPLLPRSIARVVFMETPEAELTAVGNLGFAEGVSRTGNVSLMAGDRKVFCAEGMIFVKAAPKPSSVPPDLRMYESRWTEISQLTRGTAIAGGRHIISVGKHAGLLDWVASSSTPVEVIDNALSLEGKLRSLATRGPGDVTVLMETVLAHSSDKNIVDRIAEALVELRDLIRVVATTWTVGRARVVIPIQGERLCIDAEETGGSLVGALRSFVRTSHFECPTVQLRTVMYEAADADGNSVLFDELINLSAETDLMIVKGRRFARRIVPLRLERKDAPYDFGKDGYYIVTGAAGSLGMESVNWLRRSGARRILALSRSGIDESIISTIAAGELRNVKCDVACTSDWDDVLADVPASWGNLLGMIHSAGRLQDGAMFDMDKTAFADVIRPKLQPVLNIASRSSHSPWWLICFSSAAAQLGSPGQANYAAANGAMAAASAALTERGVRTLCIAWGPWSDGGMVRKTARNGGRLSELGVSLISREGGFQALEALLNSPSESAMILPFDLKDLSRFYPEAPGLSALDFLIDSEVLTLRNHSYDGGSTGRPDLQQSFVPAGSVTEERLSLILRQALGIDRVGIYDNFFELGGDSVVGNQILIDINREFNLALDANDVFSDFNVANIAKVLDTPKRPVKA